MRIDSLFLQGHAPGRPLFGSCFCGGPNQELLASWGVDGNLSLWDSYAPGNIYSPMAILRSDSEYPIYAVDLSDHCIAVGGGSDGGFVGIPLYLYDFPSEMTTTTMCDDSSNVEKLADTFHPKNLDETKENDECKGEGNRKPESRKQSSLNTKEQSSPADKRIKTDQGLPFTGPSTDSDVGNK